MTTLYIAGPMTGIENYNYPAFNAAEHRLREAGYEVLNPARRGIVDGWEWADYMRSAIRDVLAADGLALLDGWIASKGARLEARIAGHLGLEVLHLRHWLEDARGGGQ